VRAKSDRVLYRGKLCLNVHIRGCSWVSLESFLMDYCICGTSNKLRPSPSVSVLFSARVC
jgi:hypothetical protein